MMVFLVIIIAAGIYYNSGYYYMSTIKQIDKGATPTSLVQKFIAGPGGMQAKSGKPDNLEDYFVFFCWVWIVYVMIDIIFWGAYVVWMFLNWILWFMLQGGVYQTYGWWGIFTLILFLLGIIIIWHKKIVFHKKPTVS